MGRKQVISSFSGITIDMDYLLCIPSIHAIYDKEEIVIDYCNQIVLSKSNDLATNSEQLVEYFVQSLDGYIISEFK